MAPFHCMIHRLLTIPLDKKTYNKEYNYILDTARTNGFNKNTIDRIIHKKKLKLDKNNLTTLYTQNSPETKRSAVTYQGNISKKIKKSFSKYNIEIIETNRKNQLKSRLNSGKDKKETHEKSGIYRITCSHCDKTYIGQTKRLATVRLKEHLDEARRAIEKDKKDNLRTKTKHVFKSKFAEHIYLQNHGITLDDLKVIKQVNNKKYLDVCESLEISKIPESQKLNNDNGNCYSWLFKFI